MTRVISIQSQVVHGHVGNSAAVFPLQSKGIEVAAVPTALLSNHLHYESTYGSYLEPDLLDSLLCGVEDRGWLETSSVLITGFVGSLESAHVLATFVERARLRNPSLLYVCDPVMGDADHGIFVKESLVDVFRARLVPMAQFITPNQYELEVLARRKARTIGDLQACLETLDMPNATGAAVTGCVLDDTAKGHVETVSWTPRAMTRSVVERLPLRPCGTGDLFTALLVAAICDGEDLAQASARATEGVFAVLQSTLAAKSNEMVLTGFSQKPSL